MNGQRILSRIGRRIPAWLRALRARMLLEGYAGHLGTDEVACPACRGGGAANGQPLERCPICRGFGDVPGPLAWWYEDQLRRALVGSRPRLPSGERQSARPIPLRYGRLAELCCKVHGEVESCHDISG